MLTSSRVVAYTLLAAVFITGMALVYIDGDDAGESAYPTPKVIKNYKAGFIIEGTCEGFGPRCIDYEDLTHRQRVRCFTLRDDTYDPFCARIRTPRGELALPFVNDYVLEGLQDPRVRTLDRKCLDVRTSCYYVVRVRGIRQDPCGYLRQASDNYFVPIPDYPQCLNRNGFAHLNSTLRNPEVRDSLYTPGPAW